MLQMCICKYLLQFFCPHRESSLYIATGVMGLQSSSEKMGTFFFHSPIKFITALKQQIYILSALSYTYVVLLKSVALHCGK